MDMYHPGISSVSDFDYAAANFQNMIVDMTSSPSDDSDSKNVSEDSIGKRDFKKPRLRGYKVFFHAQLSRALSFNCLYKLK